MKKTTQFKKLLQSNELEFLLEAHSGLSARIVEEAGFKGIWASGLGMSASMGVRDNNEASWTQVLEVVEFMSDATSIPILLDADSGYGNFNNVRRLIRKLEQRGVAAVCIEDKLFPKTNSFLRDGQALATIDEFTGKIKAAKDTQTDPDFCVLGRVEALIAGRPMEEALERAEAYYHAGADAILIHSKSTGPEQVLEFARRWNQPCSIVIMPTTYLSTPTCFFRETGIRLLIWANHLLRSSIAAMQRMASILSQEQSASSVQDQIAPLTEIFRLQNVAELQEAERRYLPDALGAATSDKKIAAL